MQLKFQKFDRNEAIQVRVIEKYKILERCEKNFITNQCTLKIRREITRGKKRHHNKSMYPHTADDAKAKHVSQVQEDL